MLVKKVFCSFLVFVFLFTGICVSAETHSKEELIPIQESATVESDSFTYQGMSYSSDGRGKFLFQAITNKTDKKLPVSIDLLLFDQNKKNIGFVTYCTEQDYGGEYSLFTLKAKESTPFSISLSEKYFVEGKSTSDLSYYAVLDENPYCKIGGYDKYSGLTIEEIVNGTVTVDGEEVSPFQFPITIEVDMKLIMIVLGAVLFAFFVQGLFLNALHKRMYFQSTILSFLPYTCNYIAVKLAFGQKVGNIYKYILIGSIFLAFVPILNMISILISFVSGIAYILDFVKLVTKNYHLFVIGEELIQSPPPLEQKVEAGFRLPDRPTTPPVSEPVTSPVTEPVTSPMTEAIGGPVEVPTTPMNQDLNSESDNFQFDLDDFSDMQQAEPVSTSEENPTTIPNQKEGESELMDLFK